MTYELAKQLKDAGFPQTKTCTVVYFYDAGSSASYQREFTSEETKLPTLSKLIEAVGDSLYSLAHLQGKWYVSTCEWGSERWLNGNWKEIEGSTPEEAVAKLWLALHSMENAVYNSK